MKRSLRIFFSLLVPSSILLFGRQASVDQRFYSLQAPTATVMDINNFVVWTSYTALAGHNMWNPKEAEYPRGKLTALYGDGLMWGGIVYEGSARQIRVGGFEYVSGNVPGVIVSPGIAENPNDPSVRVYRIRKDFLTADLRADASEFLNKPTGELTLDDIARVRAQYEKDWEEWPVAKGAPFFDSNGNGVRDPGEEPGLLGADMVIWFVVNDLDSTVTKNFYGSPSMGLETQITWWAFKGTKGPLGNSIFMRYVIIYKGTSQSTPSSRIDSMYVTKWSDPDIGGGRSDYVGCDTTYDIGFVYQSEFPDPQSIRPNVIPPSVGDVLLQGPAVPASPSDQGYFDFQQRNGISNLRMTSFFGHRSGSPFSDPRPRGSYFTSTLRVYKWIRGYLPVDVALESFYDNNGLPTKFFMAGDPVLRTGWYDGVDPSYGAGERRFLLNSGPFTMARGDTQVVMYALVARQGLDRLKSVNAMKFYCRQVQSMYRTPQWLLGQSGGDAEELSVPDGYSLRQNYPNPFNPATSILYSVPVDGDLKLAVYDVLGRELRVLVNEYRYAGDVIVEWDGRDGNGKEVPTGVYFYRLVAGHVQQTKKMLIVR